MNLTARQLRTGLRSPSALSRQLLSETLAPTPPGTPRNPQRRWIDASIRRYFENGRDAAVLLSDYDARTGRSRRRERAESEIGNGRRMLERFLRLDAGEPDPARIQLPPISGDVLGVRVTLGVDLVYAAADGTALRLLVTDQEISRPEHFRLYAAAALLHFEERRERAAPVARVDVWFLRRERLGEMAWTREELVASLPRLSARLEDIRRGAAGQAA